MELPTGGEPGGEVSVAMVATAITLGAETTVGATGAACSCTATLAARTGLELSGTVAMVRQHLCDAGPTWLWQSPAIVLQHCASLTDICAASMAHAISGVAKRNATTPRATARARSRMIVRRVGLPWSTVASGY